MDRIFSTADILLPKKSADMTKWSVVACDQYTSEPEYWEETERIVGDAPSALRLILPEIYLEDKPDERIDRIHAAMEKYLSEDIFDEYKDALIYTERVTSDGVRAGIIGKIDLEAYDYSKGSTSPVRATEATVPERIPPRIKVRRGAPVESPHIMILIDDAAGKVIEPLSAKKGSMKKLYDFDLMQNGGHITGYLMDKADADSVLEALSALGDKEAFNKRYGLDGDVPPLVYAMGDGNHSLATAKAYYEELKRNSGGKDMSEHPARYALAEIVDLHSPAIRFEAIHRIVTDVDADRLMDEMRSALSLSESGEGQHFTEIHGGVKKTYYINAPTSNLSVGSVQDFIDGYLEKNGGKVDYIHGADVAEGLAAKENSIAFLLPDMKKEELFPTVIKDGSLPRKTFSMGHAYDKRYYTECRRISE